MNIVVPMAGRGSRFADVGYSDPKPLIKVEGTEMIKLVIDNLTPIQEHRFVFICQAEHVKDYGLQPKLTEWAAGCEIVEISGITDGAACTVLEAREFIDTDEPLMIANSDQYVEGSIDDYLAELEANTLDGLIMTMIDDDPKWSFVEKDSEGLVSNVVEKVVVSDEATVGIYNFRHGADFVAAADKMIAADDRVNGEFYVAPTYNAMIRDGARIGSYSVGPVCVGMFGLGTPADLEIFLARHDSVDGAN